MLNELLKSELLKTMLADWIGKDVRIMFGEFNHTDILIEVRKKKVTGWKLVPEKRNNKTPLCTELIFANFTLSLVDDDYEVVAADGVLLKGDTCISLQLI